MTPRRSVPAFPACLAVAFVLSACGSSSSPASDPGTLEAKDGVSRQPLAVGGMKREVVRGVAPLQLNTSMVSVRIGGGSPATARWTPADPRSRIQVVPMGGSHDPDPLAAAIVCDAPDGDGQVQIDGSLLDEFYRLSCNGEWMLKCSRITRYSRDVRPMGDRQVELFVGSARNLQMAFE